MRRPILFVRADSAIQPVPATELSEAGFAVDVVYTHGRPLPHRLTCPIDLAVLEAGVVLTGPVRSWVAPAPLIVISPAAEDIDRILGLELGADDVMVAPYNPRELISRIRNILGAPRPTLLANRGRTTNFFNWTLEHANRMLTHSDGGILRLSPSEYRVLRLFLDSRGQTLSREDIQRLTGEPDQPNIPLRGIDVIVNRLRAKLFGNSPFHVLQTVHGRGYRMRLLRQLS